MRVYLFLFMLLLAFSQSFVQAECQDSCTGEPLVLSLESAISRALNYNRQLFNTFDTLTKSQFNLELAEADFNFKIVPNARAGYVGGGSVGEGPSIGTGIDFHKKFKNGTRFTIGPSVFWENGHYRSDIRTILTQPLLRGMGREYTLSGINAAKFSMRSAYRSVFTAQLQLVMRTIASLYEVIKAKKALELSQESYQRIEKFYRAAKLKERIGLSDALDVYRAEIELRQAEDALVSAQERILDAEDTLRDLLALPMDVCLDIQVPLVFTQCDICLDDALNAAFENRVEMDQAEDQWRENFRLSRIAKENLWPELNLVLNYSNCGRDQVFTRSCTRHRESTWGLGFTTAADFNPVADRAAYEQSLLAIDTADRGIEQTKANLTLEVKRVLRTLQRAYKRIYLQEQQIYTAQGELHLSKIKFDRGLANNFDVIQAEKTLRSAQLSYWNAVIEHIVGEYQLLLALGILTDKPCIP